MRSFTTWMVAAMLAACVIVPQASGGYGGIEGAAARHCGRGGCLGRAICRGGECGRPSSDCQCYTVMKTMTRTVYENVSETCQKVVYDTVYDRQTVQDVSKCTEVCYRQEQFNYQRPVYETVTSQVPYTVCRPVCETQTREVTRVRYVPSYETRTRSVPYTVYQTVTETGTRTVCYRVPRQECYTKQVPVMSGHWEMRTFECPAPVQRCNPPCGQKGADQKGAEQKGAEQKSAPTTYCKKVWVPCVEYKEVTCKRTVYDTCTMEVPYTRCRRVPETCTREVQYTVCRMVPINETRTVQVPVVRMMTEQQFRTVCRTVTHMVTEVGTRTVPYTVTREVPVTREVCVPRQVPRTVCITVNRCVPRTECYQVPVRVCVPLPCDPKGGKGKADSDPSKAEEGPAPPEPTEVEKKESESTVSNQGGLFRTASMPTSPTAEVRHAQFAAGCEQYRNGRFQEAAEIFRTVLSETPANAKYAYYYAAALRRAGLDAEADGALENAISIEKQSPMAQWGLAMERIQGSARIWIEQRRNSG